MVGCEYVIHRRVNSVLDRSYFRRNSQSVRTIPKSDNYNEYNYDQVSGEKHTGQRQYIIPGLEV